MKFQKTVWKFWCTKKIIHFPFAWQINKYLYAKHNFKAPYTVQVHISNTTESTKKGTQIINFLACKVKKGPNNSIENQFSW